MKTLRPFSPVLIVVGLLFADAALAQKRSPMEAVQDDPALPRVLVIGDSISIGYTLPTRDALAGKVNLHRPLTNCGDTAKGLSELDAWLGDGRWDVIHFNWGLHDLKRLDGVHHQVPLDRYEKNLAELVARLKKTGAALVWCSTTPVPEGCKPPRSEADVAAYNAAAKKIMDAQEVAIDDLHAFALARLEDIQRPANVHFSPQGSAVLAEAVAKSIQEALK